MEPSLHDIEDYNNHESAHKRKVVNLTVLLLFLGAMIYGGVRFYLNSQGYESYTHVVPTQELQDTRAR